MTPLTIEQALQPALEDLSSRKLAMLVCCGILFLSCLSTLRGSIFGVKAPVVGYRSFFEPSWLLGLRFVKGSSPMIREGYRKFKDSMFKVRRNDGYILVISNKHVDHLRNMPDEKISAIRAHVKNHVGRYSTLRILLESDLHTRVVQQKLTPMLGSTVPIVKDELDFALRVEVSDCKDKWVKVQIFEILQRIVARISARIFLGPLACRNEEWLAASIQYTKNVFVTAMTLRMFPSYLHPFLALVLPAHWRVYSNLRTAKRIVSPMVRERRAAEAREDVDYKKPQDLLQGMMDTADAHDGNPDKLAHRQLLLSLASIHTTTMSAAHALYDLCAHPELFEPLRTEVVEVLREDGGWQKTTFNKLRKLDSFLKESQRVNPPSQLSFNRVVCEPIKLSDGTTLPAGTRFSIASDAILQDSANVPGDPSVFDPFRYSRLREDPTHPENMQKFQFAMTDSNNLHFGHGKYSCPGRFFASIEIKMILSHLLLGYDFKYPDGHGRPKNISADEYIYPDPAARLLMRRREISEEGIGALVGI